MRLSEHSVRDSERFEKAAISQHFSIKIMVCY